jgi:hypothetical protein
MRLGSVGRAQSAFGFSEYTVNIFTNYQLIIVRYAIIGLPKIVEGHE